MTDSRAIKRLAVRAAALTGTALAGLVLLAPAHAAPLWPGGPEIPMLGGNIQGPAVSPGEGSIVGGKRAIDVEFASPALDRAAAERSITVAPSIKVAGQFTWVTDRHVRWSPQDHWPRGTTVKVTVAGRTSSFSVANDFTGVADAAAHTLTVRIGGDVVRTMPASMGKPGHESPNGSFPVLEKFPHMIMDSSTYGVPVNSPQGYKLPVEWATRLTWSGIFVHAAPWSVAQQGKANVSHGCLNVSTADAKWYFDNVRNSDKVDIINAK